MRIATPAMTADVAKARGGEVRATRRLLWLGDQQERHHAGHEDQTPHPLVEVWMPVVCPRLHRQCEQHGENDQRLHQQDRTQTEGRCLCSEPPTAMTAPIHHLALMAPESADRAGG